MGWIHALGDPLFLAAARRRAAASSGDELIAVLVSGGGVVVGVLILVAIIRRFLFICGPHEVLVFSGRKTRLKSGRTINYAVMRGGRGFRKPFLETVRRMDMRLFPVEVVVQNAYSAGGIPLTVRAIANVKLADGPTLRNAVERFLDYHPAQIAIAAQQTLEGVLREVISQLTPEEVNEDRLKFANILMDNARDDFDKLGLDLNVLKVQHVSDEQSYLANLGRARIANMLRDAENAENAADQAVAEARAAAREAAETATKRAETKVVGAKNNADAELAELEANARETENQAEMAAETARMKAEQKLQELRSQLEQLRLHCDVVLPANAKQKAEELKAAGQAAPAIENGRATAEALRLVSSEWKAAGAAGRDLYVIQQLQSLVNAAALRVAKSDIDEIKMVAGDENAYGMVLAAYPQAVARVLTETGAALGIDIPRLLGGALGDAAAEPTDGGGGDDGPPPGTRRGPLGDPDFVPSPRTQRGGTK